MVIKPATHCTLGVTALLNTAMVTLEKTGLRTQRNQNYCNCNKLSDFVAFKIVALKTGTRCATSCSQLVSSKQLSVFSLKLTQVKLEIMHNLLVVKWSPTSIDIHINFLYSQSSQNFIQLKQRFLHKWWRSCCKTAIWQQYRCSATSLLNKNITRKQPLLQRDASQTRCAYKLDHSLWQSVLSQTVIVWRQVTSHSITLQTKSHPEVEDVRQSAFVGIVGKRITGRSLKVFPVKKWMSFCFYCSVTES